MYNRVHGFKEGSKRVQMNLTKRVQIKGSHPLYVYRGEPLNPYRRIDTEINTQ